ncbi:hypothetical protein AVEN_270581-1 [Araneus ventricosus]|uniref:Uncharacterized protein n=1 Tax=Araneus ventricosus TaxID=182803 RepID=A0A4Y2B7S7_ARAVE|nr:hypothetical protein AVEN_270581-1 [Araneus ventricosus]
MYNLEMEEMVQPDQINMIKSMTWNRMRFKRTYDMALDFTSLTRYTTSSPFGNIFLVARPMETISNQLYCSLYSWVEYIMKDLGNRGSIYRRIDDTPSEQTSDIFQSSHHRTVQRPFLKL